MSDIDTVVVDSLKVLDPKWPIREADIDGVLAPLRWTAKCQRVSRRLAASHSLANLEPLKLRVPEIEWLVVTGLMVCGPECL